MNVRIFIVIACLIAGDFSGNAYGMAGDDGSDDEMPLKRPKRIERHIHLPENVAEKGMSAMRGKMPQEIRDLIDYFKNRHEYARMGAVMPTGLLLVGKPGTGKTSLAKSIADEAGFGFVSTTGASFADPYMGQERKNIEEVFNNVRALSQENEQRTAVLFIDEFDAIGSRQSSHGLDTGYKQAIATLLVEMEKKSDYTTEYIFAASNAADSIDPAFKRPGRFDRIVEVPLPDGDDRKEILKFYAAKTRYNKHEINFDELALLTEDFSPADLKHLVNEAAICAVRAGDDCIMMDHFFKARESFNQRVVSANKQFLRSRL